MKYEVWFYVSEISMFILIFVPWVHVYNKFWGYLSFQETTEKVIPYLNEARIHVNTVCAGLEAWQIILYTLGVTLILVSIYNFIFDEEKSKSDSNQIYRKNFKYWERSKQTLQTQMRLWKVYLFAF